MPGINVDVVRDGVDLIHQAGEERRVKRRGVAGLDQANGLVYLHAHTDLHISERSPSLRDGGSTGQGTRVGESKLPLA